MKGCHHVRVGPRARLARHSGPPSRRLATDQSGFALLAVTLVLALLGVVVTELAFSMRLEAAMVRSYKDAILARHLAEAGIQQAIREVLSDSTIQGLDEEGQVVFYQVAQTGAKPKALPKLPRSHVQLGPGQFSYRITDEEGRLNINGGQRGLLDKLLTTLGVDKQERDVVTDSLEDWRDANETHRINGAESDYYLQLPVPYRARDSALQDITELLQIKGITPELYYGHEDRPGLVDLVTARGRGTININTAPKIILQAAGLSDAEIDDVLQARAVSPYSAVPTRGAAAVGGRTRFSVSSTTFRIEAEGLIGGEPRARLLALVQRMVGPQSAVPTLTVYTWRPLPLRSPVKEGEAK